MTALETEVVQIKEQIEPLLTLPASVEKSNQEMKKGFSETQDQLAQLSALIQRSLSPANQSRQTAHLPSQFRIPQPTLAPLHQRNDPPTKDNPMERKKSL